MITSEMKIEGMKHLLKELKKIKEDRNSLRRQKLKDDILCQKFKELLEREKKIRSRIDHLSTLLTDEERIFIESATDYLDI